jgi:hypothetical protein
LAQCHALPSRLTAAPANPISQAAEAEFMEAMKAYKAKSGRMFPTWSEVLEVLRDLGYKKTNGLASPAAAPERSELDRAPVARAS